MPNEPWLMTEEVKKQIIAAYQDGTSGNVIAKRYGVSNQTVYNLLHSRGVTVQRRGRRSKGGTEALNRPTVRVRYAWDRSMLNA